MLWLGIAVAAAATGKWIGMAIPIEAPRPVYVEGGPAPGSSPLEIAARGAMVAADRTEAASSDAGAAAEDAEAWIDADYADSVADGTEQGAAAARARASSSMGANTESIRAAMGALSASGQAEASYRAAQRAVAKAERMATDGVSQSVEKELGPIYMGLQDWKMKVLHDPATEGKKAGIREAKPYETALRKVEKWTADYELRATSLSNEGRAVRTSAVSLANQAVAEQAAGQLEAARKDMMNAHQMWSQAGKFEEQAHALMTKAHAWANKVPGYAEAAQHASHAAAYRYGKNLYAPPPDPSIAAAEFMPRFALMQRSSLLHRNGGAPLAAQARH